ncbi:unnamed protein product, partial [Ilex paraguariensis]
MEFEQAFASPFRHISSHPISLPPHTVNSATEEKPYQGQPLQPPLSKPFSALSLSLSLRLADRYQGTPTPTQGESYSKTLSYTVKQYSPVDFRMDKSEVVMEDVEKQSQASASDRRDSEDDLVDAQVDPQQEQLSHPEAPEDQNSCEERAEDQNNVKKDPSPGKNVVPDQYASDNASEEKNTSEIGKPPVELPVDKVPMSGKKELVDEPKEPDNTTTALVAAGTDGIGEMLESNLPKEEIPVDKNEGDDTPLANQHEPATPNLLVKCSSAKAEVQSGDTFKNGMNESKMSEDDDDGTPEDQAAFMKELESFYRERAMEFKPPRFYGHPLNCLKLWRAVIKLGGYDRVTGSKLWRQVGESFHPPKTCTTVSWTFRIFYEKALLEYERHKRQNGELQLPIAALPESSVVESE